MRALFLSLLLSACAPPLALGGAPCPCVTGWVCCPGLALCATELSQCDAIAGPDVSPRDPEVGVGRTLRFGTSAQDVRWEVEEGQGTIDSTGFFVAPREPGVVHVIARSSLGATRVTVAVRELRMSVLAGQYGGRSEVPIDGVQGQSRLSLPSGGVFAGDAYFFVDDVDDFVIREPPTGPYLRRYDPVTQRLETIFASGGQITGVRVDGPRAQARFRLIEGVAPAGADRVLVIDDGCIRELEATTLAVSTLRCVSQTGFGRYRGFVGDGENLFASHDDHTLVRLSKDGGEEVIAGISGQSGEPDGGLLRNPRGLALSGSTLYAIDQAGTAVRALDLDAGTLRTITSGLSAPLVALTISSLPSVQGELVTVDFEGTVSVGSLQRRTGIPTRGMAFAHPDSVILTSEDSLRSMSLLTGAQRLLAGRPAMPPRLSDGAGVLAGFDFSGGVVLSAQGDSVWVAEGLSRTLRFVARSGEVTTHSTNVRASSMAVDATHVYICFEGSISRAPKTGGPFTTLPAAYTGLARLLGVLDDGRLAVMDDGQLSFIEPATFSIAPARLDQLGLIPEFGRGFSVVLDSSGGLFFGTSKLLRFDIATQQVTELASAPPPTFFPAGLVAHAGHIYSFGTGTPLSAEVFVSEPSAREWRHLFGMKEGTAVLPGPLTSASLHAPGALAVLSNGDLIIADLAEHTLLVVE